MFNPIKQMLLTLQTLGIFAIQHPCAHSIASTASTSRTWNWETFGQQYPTGPQNSLIIPQHFTRRINKTACTSGTPSHGAQPQRIPTKNRWSNADWKHADGHELYTLLVLFERISLAQQWWFQLVNPGEHFRIKVLQQEQ